MEYWERGTPYHLPLGRLLCPRTLASQAATLYWRRKLWLGALVILSFMYICLLATLGDLEQVSWSFLAPIMFVTYLFHSLDIGFRRLIFGRFFFFFFWSHSDISQISLQWILGLPNFYALRKIFCYSAVCVLFFVLIRNQI